MSDECVSVQAGTYVPRTLQIGWEDQLTHVYMTSESCCTNYPQPLDNGWEVQPHKWNFVRKLYGLYIIIIKVYIHVWPEIYNDTYLLSHCNSASLIILCHITRIK